MSYNKINFSINDYMLSHNRNKEEIKMSNRNIATVVLIDNDPSLPVDESVVWTKENIVYEGTREQMIQELLLSEDIAGAIAEHNEVRIGTVDIDILNRTGNSVYLQSVRIKDLDWIIK